MRFFHWYNRNKSDEEIELLAAKEIEEQHMDEDGEDEKKHESDGGRESSNADESESSHTSQSSQEPPDNDDEVGWQIGEQLLNKKIKGKERDKTKKKVRFNIKKASGPYRSKDKYNRPIQSITDGLHETHQFQYSNHRALMEKEKKKDTFLPPEQLQRRLRKGIKRNRNNIFPDEDKSTSSNSGEEGSVDVSFSDSAHTINNQNDPNRTN